MELGKMSRGREINLELGKPILTQWNLQAAGRPLDCPTEERDTIWAQRTVEFCFLICEQTGSNPSKAVTEFPYDRLLCGVVIPPSPPKNLVE